VRGGNLNEQQEAFPASHTDTPALSDLPPGQVSYSISRPPPHTC